MSSLGIAGASISRCPWLTWVDFLHEDLGHPTMTNFATKGAGNEFILRSASHLTHSIPTGSVIAFMLTNFDKYDYWVEGKTLNNLRNEKHQPVWLNGKPAEQQGYWCTGSHFPKLKRKFKSTFENLVPVATRQMFELLGTITMLKQQGYKVIVLADSPIFDYSEQQINQLNQGNNDQQLLDLAENNMLQSIVETCHSHVVDFNGLIGYCINKNLNWKHLDYGPHPPSDSHLEYYSQVIQPWIQKTYPDVELHGISEATIIMSKRMSSKWLKNEF